MTPEYILGALLGDSIIGVFDKWQQELIYKAMQKYADQEVEKARNEMWESEYGTGDSKGIPLTPEETKKFWEELPAQMAEKYSEKNMKLLMDYLSPKP